MRNFLQLFLVVSSFFCLDVSAQISGYVIPNSEVHTLSSPATERPYQVWVSLPANYNQTGKKYPVVFVTDPQYSFSLVHGVRHLVGRRGQNIEDFVLVGLAMPPGADIGAGRSRDYTPSDPLPKDRSLRDPNNYSYDQYGEAEIYRRYVDETVFPFIERNYRVDMRRKVFIGHSYGGLFGACMLLTKPSMFERYILGSPSFWFDKHKIFELEARYASSHRDLHARVMMFAGSFETQGEGERYYKETDLVGDMQRFANLLQNRKYPNLEISAKVMHDEDHYTVFAVMLSRGLLWALPGFGPYTSG